VLPNDFFDIIGCLEGIEHIEEKFHDNLISALKKALKKDGVLIVSSPESQTSVSGPSISNQWHKWEMTGSDFIKLLRKHFETVEFITQKATLSTGVSTTCYYGVCHK
jgi:2-polyprenyl-3-methyl-5-hydroxy-6-metoxy-1,4-benzoquinol methylase